MPRPTWLSQHRNTFYHLFAPAAPIALILVPFTLSSIDLSTSRPEAASIYVLPASGKMDRLTTGWVNYLRNSSRQEPLGRNPTCPACGAETQNMDQEAFRKHVKEEPQKHPDYQNDAKVDEVFKELMPNTNLNDKNERKLHTLPAEHNSPSKAGKKRPIPGATDNPEGAADSGLLESGPGRGEAFSGRNKKLCSPPASVDQQRGPSPPGRSRARPRENVSEFDRGYGSKNPSGRLWNPNEEPGSKTPQSRLVQPSLSSHTRNQTPQSTKSRRHQVSSQTYDSTLEDASTSVMIREPDTRPISQQQLVPEVKGIYAGLVMVESKCIEVDNAQSANTDADHQLSNEQWQALIALHRTLLHEHHDFFLASQHPSASPALRRLAHKYAMPARMWRHGIHSFLELLRHKLPDSLEHMLSFIYLSYSIMALLYETVPAFEETWIECLGDLGRYRMAIEDDDIRDREVWTGVSRYWYSKASEKNPTTGRLYHHLAILARPNALQQLYYYTKSLSVPIPFPSARESIMTLFDPVLNSNSTRLQPVDAAFVRIHGILISGKSKDQLGLSIEEFFGLLDGHIGKTTKRWLESGYYIGIALGCLLLEYGADSNVLMVAMSQRADETDVAMVNSTSLEHAPSETFEKSLVFFKRTYEIVIRRWGDMNTLPFLHTTLVFLSHMTAFPAAMVHLESEFPWKLTSAMLNLLMKSCKFEQRIEDSHFPGPPKGEAPRPLPEDYAMRGLVYSEDYFPLSWFSNVKIEEDEKYFELGSMIDERQERILWLGRRIARSGKWLLWDEVAQKFGVDAKYDFELDEDPNMGNLTTRGQSSPVASWPESLEAESSS